MDVLNALQKGKLQEREGKRDQVTVIEKKSEKEREREIQRERESERKREIER